MLNKYCYHHTSTKPLVNESCSSEESTATSMTNHCSTLSSPAAVTQKQPCLEISEPLTYQPAQELSSPSNSKMCMFYVHESPSSSFCDEDSTAILPNFQQERIFAKALL